MSHASELDPMLVTPLRRRESRPRKRALSAGVQLGSQPLVRKIALVLVIGGLTAAFAGRITTFALHPVLLTHRTGTQIRTLEVQLRQETAINDQIRSDIRYLKTSAGLEQEARRRGWVKPGEVALRLARPDEQLAALPLSPEETAKPRLSWAGRVRSAVDTCLAVFGGSGNRAAR